MDHHQVALPHSLVPGGELPFLKIFEAQPSLQLILSPDLYVQAASDAYLRETLTTRENVVGRYVFSIFPDNPDLPGGPSSPNLVASIHQVLTTGKEHHMETFRYDIPDPQQPGNFLERYWLTTNAPVFTAPGKVGYIIHQITNITGQEKARQGLQESQQREKAALADAGQQRLRLERLLQQAPAAIALLEGPDLVYKVVNDAYRQLMPGRALLGLPLLEALPELQDQPIAGIMHKVYRTGETFEGKEVLVPVARSQDQPVEDIYWNFIYQALYDAEGQVNGMLIFALDVTGFVNARRQVERSAAALQALNYDLEQRIETRTQELLVAQAEAERQRQRLENLFMEAPAGICILDGEHLVFELVNPAYQQLFPGRQLLGQPILAVLPEIADNPAYRSLQEVYRTGKSHEDQGQLIPFARPEDGVLENRFFRYVQQPRFDEQGQVNGVIVFTFEITDQVQDRRQAEEKARQLHFLANAMPQKVWTATPTGEVDYCNQQWLDYTGLPAEELLGQAWESCLHPEDRQESLALWQLSLASGQEFQMEQRMKRKDGTYRWQLTRALAHAASPGLITMWVGTTTDIDDHKRTEQALQELAQELTAANVAIMTSNADLAEMNRQLTHTNDDLDQFIYAASHDLKAPILNIEQLIEELLVELPPDSLHSGESHQIIQLIRGAVERFKKTIADLTEISKLQKDIGQQPGPVSLSAVVSEVQLDLQHLIDRSGIEVEINLPGPCLVSFSEKNLRSIVYNLFSNAIKYRDPVRQPWVQISFREEETWWVLTVADNGLGLGTDQQQKLFTMFRRFHDHVEGAGVGLFMVRRMIENAGGKIAVTSKLGQGTTFQVYFQKSPVHI